MSNITKTLLKNGVSGLVDHEDEYFKQNMCQALALKLNESMEDAYKDSVSMLFVKNTITEESNQLKEFIEFIENFQPGKFELKNKSVINITESDITAIKNLFDALDSKNRHIMINEIFEDPSKFKRNLDFYNNIKGLIG